MTQRYMQSNLQMYGQGHSSREMNRLQFNLKGCVRSRGVQVERTAVTDIEERYDERHWILRESSCTFEVNPTCIA